MSSKDACSKNGTMNFVGGGNSSNFSSSAICFAILTISKVVSTLCRRIWSARNPRASVNGRITSTSASRALPIDSFGTSAFISKDALAPISRETGDFLSSSLIDSPWAVHPSATLTARGAQRVGDRNFRWYQPAPSFAIRAHSRRDTQPSGRERGHARKLCRIPGLGKTAVLRSSGSVKPAS